MQNPRDSPILPIRRVRDIQRVLEDRLKLVARDRRHAGTVSTTVMRLLADIL